MVSAVHKIEIMAIEKVKMFTVICDNCKESADEGSDYSCWNDENGAKEVAMEAGFINNNGNDYCPKCYSYNDEDELEINSQRTKIDNSVFPKHLLEKLATEPFDYFLGVDTYDKKAMALCLSRKTEKGVEILLSKVSQDEVSFENEVKLLSELFNARVLRSGS